MQIQAPDQIHPQSCDAEAAQTDRQTFGNDAPAAGATALCLDAAALVRMRSRARRSSAPHPRIPPGCCQSPRPGCRNGPPGTRWGRRIWLRPSSEWPRGAAPPPRPETGTPRRCPIWWLCRRTSLKEQPRTGAFPCRPSRMLTSRVAATAAEVTQNLTV